MRKRLIALPLVLGFAGAVAFAGPAFAASNGGTPVTIEVGAGSLNITVPGAPVSLGSVAVSAAASVS